MENVIWAAHSLQDRCLCFWADSRAASGNMHIKHHKDLTSLCEQHGKNTVSQLPLIFNIACYRSFIKNHYLYIGQSYVPPKCSLLALKLTPQHTTLFSGHRFWEKADYSKSHLFLSKRYVKLTKIFLSEKLPASLILLKINFLIYLKPKGVCSKGNAVWLQVSNSWHKLRFPAGWATR